MAALRITQCGNFTYKKGWQTNLKHKLTDLRFSQGGSFTYNTVWQFYI